MKRKSSYFYSFLLTILIYVPSVFAQDYQGWFDNGPTRVKALALLQTLNATLLSNNSATLTLGKWCEDHLLASEPKIRAVRDQTKKIPASDEIRLMLKVSTSETIAYRRVQLSCGKHVLSEADNWYVPSRLTNAMNTVLEHSETPFGLAVKNLNFSRRTQNVKVLWSPLPEQWELRALPPGNETSILPIPAHVLRHSALLYSDNGIPFSYVVETYTRAIFSFNLNGPIVQPD
jgi:chorismate-pyruvate lyase